jgi:hypothetical protein
MDWGRIGQNAYFTVRANSPFNAGTRFSATANLKRVTMDI